MFHRSPRAAALGFCAALALTAGITYTASTAGAAGRPAAQPSAVAVVDLERVRQSLDEWKQRDAAFTERGRKLDAELKELAERGAKAEEDRKLIKEGTTEHRAASAALFELTAQYRAKREAYQQILDLERGEIVREMFARMKDGIGKVGQREGYDVIVADDRAQELPRGDVREVTLIILQKQVLFASPRVDITQQVIDQMNADFAAGRRR